MMWEHPFTDVTFFITELNLYCWPDMVQVLNMEYVRDKKGLYPLQSAGLTDKSHDVNCKTSQSYLRPRQWSLPGL